MAETKAGYGPEDFGTGGFSQGRLKVTTFRIVANPVGNNGVKQKGITAVLEGRDAAGGKQSLWISLGGDATEQEKKFKPIDGGKALGLRAGKNPSASSKYGLFFKSLREVGFPMTRFAEKDLAALDGCTLDLNSALMSVGAENEAKIKKDGKNHPTYFFVTGFKLPDGKAAEPDGEEADDDEAEAASAEDELKTYVAKALAKAGEPVVINVLKADMVKKYEKDERVDEMTTLLKLAWCEANGFTVDRQAKTVAAADAD